MVFEMYRAIVPSAKMIDDNIGVGYRTHMGKLKFLAGQTNDIIDGIGNTPGGFKVPSIEETKKITSSKFVMMYEIWKQKNIKFDLSNYTKTFKASVDVFTSRGYWEDDNFTCIGPVILNGGTRNNWADAYRYKDDGLPETLNLDWWKELAGYNDTLIRIIISDNIRELL